ncbi:MAG: hypothetical protein QW652_04985, partial [Candidatus Nitrosotenuis sp.]
LWQNVFVICCNTPDMTEWILYLAESVYLEHSVTSIVGLAPAEHYAFAIWHNKPVEFLYIKRLLVEFYCVFGIYYQ